MDTLYPSHPLSRSFLTHFLILSNGPCSPFSKLDVSRPYLVELGEQTFNLCLDSNKRKPSPYLTNQDPKFLVTPRASKLETLELQPTFCQCLN